MPLYWMTYNAPDDPRHRSRDRWRFAWPWQWFQRNPRAERHIAVPRTTATSSARRQSLWPLLLLLLLLLLLAGGIAWFALSNDDSQDDSPGAAGSPYPVAGATDPDQPTDDSDEAGSRTTADATGAHSGDRSNSRHEASTTEVDHDLDAPECPPATESAYVITEEGNVRNMAEMAPEEFSQFTQALAQSDVDLNNLPPIIRQRIELMQSVGDFGNQAIQSLK